MNAQEEIRIRLLRGPDKVWLSLQGTVLTYRDRTWSRETILDIPVELITVQETRRFMGSRLVAALCVLFFSLLTGGAIAGMPHYVKGWYSPVAEGVFGILGAAVATIPFLIMFVRFFFKQRTITLTIAPDNGEITFWALKKNEAQIDALLREIKSRQAYVQEAIAYPLSTSLADVFEPPWKRTVALVFFFALPGIILEKPWLLLLCLAPLLIYVWSAVNTIGQPRLFRKAIRAGFRKRWQDALSLVQQLQQTRPSYIPGHLLAVDINLRLHQFPEAMSVLAAIQNEINPEYVQETQSGIVQRQRMFERKNMVLPDNSGTSD